MTTTTSTPHQYLLEIGAEELPVGFQASARENLHATVSAALSTWGVEQPDITIWTTPRRLTLWLKQLPEKQADKTLRLQGPSTQVGVAQDGGLTPAAIGFARKQGVSPDELTQENGYLVLHKQESGQPFQQLLAEAVSQWILGLPGSHFMRWASRTEKFSRPIQWVLSLWDDALLPVTIASINASTMSVGHRLLGAESIPVSSIGHYEALLGKNGVIVDHQKREAAIREALQQANTQGTVTIEADLLETVTALVEAPSVIVGNFDKAYLDLPDIVLTTVMAHHQKYFPLMQGDELLPQFLAVSNARPEAAETIRAGNERVLAARFNDAAFFFREDQKLTLADRVESLSGLTFQKGLGTMREKTDRLVQLAGIITDALELTTEQKAHAERAALLCKTDLATGMVRELTELQGEMGQVYALVNGEHPEVAAAIFEHYLPRFSGDRLPESKVSIVLSLADKIDTITAVFSQKGAKLPSGSKDPLGLRRMANGFWLTLKHYRDNVSGEVIDTLPFFKTSYGLFGTYASVSFEDMLPLMESFLRQRLDTLLVTEWKITPEWAPALLSGISPLESLSFFQRRIDYMRHFDGYSEDMPSVREPASRIAKILSKRANPLVFPYVLNPEWQFETLYEQPLLNALKECENLIQNNQPRELKRLQPFVNAFFDNLLINDPDETIREKRIQLLTALDVLYCQIADFVLLPELP